MKVALTFKQISSFQKTVLDFYKENGRMMPWRKNLSPYSIVVSELMLQQTQVERVIPKYEQFLKAFPDFQSLAKASTADVLKNWQGLGYNRRALFLKRTAEKVMNEYKSILPKDQKLLQTFPGIGPNTAGAIMAYVYNMPVEFIETNIRTVFIHHFFKDKEKVSDSSLILLIGMTLERTNPRKWNWALMDYGSHLKKTIGNINTKSIHYKKQSPFLTSNRRTRGLIIKSIVKKENTPDALSKELKISLSVITRNLKQLQKEGFLKMENRQYTLA